MKNGKPQTTERKNLPNQESIKTLAEEKNYKYWGILDEDTLKQTEMKEKVKKEYHRNTWNFLETKPISRNLIKRSKCLGSPTFKILGNIPKTDKRWTQSNLLSDKAIDDFAHGFTFGRWHRQIVSVKETWRKRTHQH